MLFDKCNLECFYCFDFHYYMAWDKLTWRLTTSDLTAAINLHGVKKGKGVNKWPNPCILLRNERENSTFSLEDKCLQVFPICIKLLLTYDHTCALCCLMVGYCLKWILVVYDSVKIGIPCKTKKFAKLWLDVVYMQLNSNSLRSSEFVIQKYMFWNIKDTFFIKCNQSVTSIKYAIWEEQMWTSL